MTASWDKTALVWRASGRELIVLRSHGPATSGSSSYAFSPEEEPVLSAAFSPDGTWVVTESDDITARIWPAAGGEPAVLRGHEGDVHSAAFSPDGKRVVTASDDGTARIWPAGGGEPIVLRGHEGPVNSAAFSPDGKWVVTASDDETARIWPASGGQPVVLAGHESPVYSAAFSPDGTRVVTASADGTARIWDVSLLYLNGAEPLWEARLATGLALVDDEVRPEPILLLPPGVAGGVRFETERVPEDLRESLSARPLREAGVSRAVRFVLDATDPALAWLALYRSLDGSEAASTRRLIVLEAIEKNDPPPVLQLAAALLREGLASELGDEKARARVAAALDAARAAEPEHPLVRAIGDWLGR